MKKERWKKAGRDGGERIFGGKKLMSLKFGMSEMRKNVDGKSERAISIMEKN